MPDTKDKSAKKSWFQRVFGGGKSGKTRTEDPREAFLSAMDPVRNEIQALLGRSRLSLRAREAQKLLQTLMQQVQTLEQKGDYAKLLDKALVPTVKALSELREAVALHKDAQGTYIRKHSAVALDAKEVLGFPADKAPAWLLEAQKSVRSLDAALRECVDPSDPNAALAYDYEEAVRRAVALRKALDPVLDRTRELEKAMRAYFNDIKGIRQTIDYLDGLPDGDGWRTELEAAQDLRDQLVQADRAKEYTQAHELLGRFKAAVKQVTAKRLTSLRNDIDTADSANKVKTVVAKLDGIELEALPVDDQVKLLRTLRSTAGKAIDAKKTPELYRTRCKIYDHMKQQPEFVEKDEGNRGEVVKNLRSDPKVAEAKVKWQTWGTDERLAFLNHVAAQQCAVMGQPVPKLSPFNKPSTDGTIEFGACNLGLLKGEATSTITINTHPDAKFDNLEEQINTILHENAHNYQLALVARYREDPDKLSKLSVDERKLLPQIMMWDENASGYVPDGPTYNRQPLEVHAWSFGNEGAAGVLGP